MPNQTKAFEDPLSSVLIFGASGHIGGPMAARIAKIAPDVKLRLATSAEAKVPALQAQFPTAEVVVCSYYDTDAMASAMQGIEAVYMITPDFTDERVTVGNMIAACKAEPAFRHLLRLMGDPPGMTMEKIPEHLRNFRGGASAAAGHTIAREMLNASGLPVTYTSIGAYYMDDLCGVWHGRGIRKADILAEVTCHHMPYVDPADVGEASANILLRRDPSDIGRDFMLHNAIDLWDFHDVSRMLSDVLGRKITYQEGPEAFKKWNGPALIAALGDGAPEFFVDYFNWEHDVVADLVEEQLGGLKGKIGGWVQRSAPRWLRERIARSLWNAKEEGIVYEDLEKLLGRKPNVLENWLSANTDKFAPDPNLA